MAVRLLAYEVSDLCLGKPPLRSLPVSATLADAVSAIRYSDDGCVSVWNCDHSSPDKNDAVDDCRCVGKISMVDVICHLCREENLLAPSSALKSPVSVLVSKVPGRVRHVEPSSSLLEAIDLILQGAQNLVVPIKTNPRRKLQKSSPNPTAHNGREFCWLTQEDVIRFLLSSIGVFTPLPALSIDTLGAISTEFLSIRYHSPAALAVGAISSSLAEQTSVAVVDDEGILIGEISPFTLACCDEIVAAAITTLSAGDLMAYIDCGGPPEDLVRVVKARLEDRKLEGMLEEFSISSDVSSSLSSFSLSSSSDEESSSSLPRSGRYSRSSSYSARMVRRAEAIVCHPWSSLAAVMIQAISHRVNYVWVVEEDCSLAGIVTFSNMLEIFYQHLQSMA
ncbi:hypothetical protein RHGRI_018450 [Rhododendron griersonianum]|uniref:CBS domain-containing protein n=1 Tax=Rhododendron griersonianum TaxID=479676 RepID=A0AAV6K1H5_9ERIC|nr:hypothetical protein RHGRI_018450 [Rhododendron griersonianum]